MSQASIKLRPLCLCATVCITLPAGHEPSCEKGTRFPRQAGAAAGVPTETAVAAVPPAWLDAAVNACLLLRGRAVLRPSGERVEGRTCVASCNLHM